MNKIYDNPYIRAHKEFEQFRKDRLSGYNTMRAILESNVEDNSDVYTKPKSSASSTTTNSTESSTNTPKQKKQSTAGQKTVDSVISKTPSLLYQDNVKKELFAKYKLELKENVLKEIKQDQEIPWDRRNKVEAPKEDFNPYLSDEAEHQRKTAAVDRQNTVNSVYTPVINKLRLEVSELEKQLKIANAPDYLTGSPIIGAAHSATQQLQSQRIGLQLAKKKKELQEAENEKNAFVVQHESLTDPIAARLSIVHNIVSTSPTMLAVQADVISAADALKTTSRFSSDYGKKIKRFAEATQNKTNTENKYYLFEKWLANAKYRDANGELRYRLPKSMDEIPMQFKKIAEELFVKDGIDLLKNPKFRKQFEESTWVPESLYPFIDDEIHKSIKDLKLGEGITEDLLELMKLENEYLREYYFMLENEIARNLRMRTAGLGQLANTSVFDNTFNTSELAAERKKLDKSIDFINKALQYKKLELEIMSREDEIKPLAAAKNIGTAFREFFFNKNTWLYNLPEAGMYKTLSDVTDKAVKGEKLTVGDMALLTAASAESLYHNMYGMHENINSYKWGNIAAQSLQFMSEFIFTHGMETALNKGLTQTGKAVAKTAASAAKSASKQFTETAMYKRMMPVMEKIAAKDGLKNGFEKMLANFKKLYPNSTEIPKLEALRNKMATAANWANKTVTPAAKRVLTDAEYALLLSNTLGVGRTMSDTYKATSGYVSVNEDPYGNFESVDTELLASTKTNFADALKQSQIRNFVENFSEMMGEWNMFTRLSKNWKGLGLYIDKYNDFVKSMDVKAASKLALEQLVTGMRWYNRNGNVFRMLSPTYGSKILRAGHWSGFVGESMEEFYGIALNHLFGTEEDPNYKFKWNDTESGAENIFRWLGLGFEEMINQAPDIFGGIALSTGMLKAISDFSSLPATLAYNSAENKLVEKFGSDIATTIRRKLLFSSDAEIVHTMQDLLDYFAHNHSVEYKNRLIGDDQAILATDNQEVKEKYQALFNYFGRLMSLRGAVFGEDIINSNIDSKYQLYRDAAKERGYSFGSFAAKRRADDVVEIMYEEANSVLKQINPDLDIEKLEGLFDNNDDLMDYVRQNYDIETASTILAYYNAKDFADKVDSRVTDGKEEVKHDAAEYVDRITYKGKELTQLNEDPKEKKIIPIILHGATSEQTHDETAELINRRKRDNTVYLIRGRVLTKGDNTAEIDSDSKSYGREEQKILVADRLGRQKVMNIEDLEGATLGNQLPATEMKMTQIAVAQQRYDDLESRYLSQIGTKIGDKVQLANGNSIVVMGTTASGGLNYAIVDENNTPIEIRHADDIDEFKEFVSDYENQESQDIAKFFSDQAKEEIAQLGRNADERAIKLAEDQRKEDRKNYILDNIDNQPEVIEAREKVESLREEIEKKKKAAEKQKNKKRLGNKNKQVGPSKKDFKRLDEAERELKKVTLLAEERLGNMFDTEQTQPEQEEQEVQPTVVPSETQEPTDASLYSELPTPPNGTIFVANGMIVGESDGTTGSGSTSDEKVSDQDDTQDEPDPTQGLNPEAENPKVEQPDLAPPTPDETSGDEDKKVDPSPVIDESKSNTLEKRNTISKLENEITISQQKKQFVSPAHYCNEIDGKNRLVLRVHTVTDSIVSDDSREEATLTISKNINSLREAFKQGGKAAVEAKANELVLNRVEELNQVHGVDDLGKSEEERRIAKNVVKYIIDSMRINEYINHIQYVLDNFEGKEKDEELESVYFGISFGISDSTTGQSVTAGSIIDKICRMYFSHLDFVRNRLKYDTFTVNIHGNEVKLSTIVGKSKKTGEDLLLMTEDVFNEILALCAILDLSFKERGWTLITGYAENAESESLPLTLCKKLNVGGVEKYVAGEVDALAVDSKGDIHIIDFKTSKSMYHQENTLKLDIQDPTGLEIVPSNSVGKNTYTNPLFTEINQPGSGKFDKPTGAQYMEQLYMYSILMPDSVIGRINGRYVLMMGLSYSNVGELLSFSGAVKNGVTGETVSRQRIAVPAEGEITVTVDGKQVKLNGKFWTNDSKKQPFLIDLQALQEKDIPVATKILQDFQNRVTVIYSNSGLMDRLIKLKEQLTPETLRLINQDYAPVFNAAQSLLTKINSLIEKLNTKDQFDSDDNNAVDELEAQFYDLSNAIDETDTLYNALVERLKKSTDLYEKQVKRILELYRPSMLLYTISGFLKQLLSFIESIPNDTDLLDLNDPNVNNFIQDAVHIRVAIDYCRLYGDQLSQEDAVELQNLIEEYNKTVKPILNGKVDSKTLNEFVESALESTTDSEIELPTPWYGRNCLMDVTSSNAGVTNSVSTTNSEHKLTDVMQDPDFITNGEFYVRKVVEKDHGVEKVKKLLLVVKFKGEEYTPVDIHIATKQSPISNKTDKKKQKAQKTEKGVAFAKAFGLGEKISDSNTKDDVRISNLSVKRSFGRILQTDDIDSVYNRLGIYGAADIRFDSTSQNTDDGLTFGLTKLKTINGIPFVVVTKPGQDGSDEILYVYSGTNEETSPSIGTIVYLKPIDRDEHDNAIAGQNKPESVKQVVPINIETAHFGIGDAQLILDIFKGTVFNNGESDSKAERLSSNSLYVDVSGKQVDTGMTAAQVINMLIPYGMHSIGSKTYVYLTAEDSDQGIVLSVHGKVEGDDKLIHSFIVGQQDYEFVRFMSNYVRLRIDKNLLSTDLTAGGNTIKNALDEVLNAGGKFLQFGESKLIFTEYDLNYSSGIKWYMDRLSLETRFNGMSHPLVEIDETIMFDPKAQTVSTQGNTNTETPLLTPSDYAKDRVERGESDGGNKNIDKRVTRSEYKEFENPIDENQAREIIRTILGDVDVKFEDDFLQVCGDIVVLGRCYQSSIVLSRKAFAGAEYHEAFHFVLELLVDNSTRKRIYNTYRKKYKSDKTNKQLAEELADDFMMYSQMRDEIGKIKLLSWNVIKTFKQLSKYIKLFSKIGDYRLWQFYRSIKNGKFANVKPTEQNIKRFRLFAGKGYLNLSYHKNGIEFDHMIGPSQYEAGLRTLDFILRHYTVNRTGLTGTNINKLNLDIEKILESDILYDLLRNPDYVAGRDVLVEMLDLDVVETDDGHTKLKTVPKTIDTKPGKKTIEVFVQKKDHPHWNQVVKDVIPMISKITSAKYTQSGTIEDEEYAQESPDSLLAHLDNSDKAHDNQDVEKSRIEEEEGSDVENEDEAENAGKSATDGHVKDADMFDPITKASAEVKYFFSYIEDSYYINVVDPNDGTKMIRKRVRRLNELGLPQYMDVTEAWRQALIDLHDSANPRDMYIRLRELSKTDAMYEQLYNNFNNLVSGAIKFSNGEDPASVDWTTKEITNHNGFGTLSQIYVCIKNAMIDKEVMESFRIGNEKNEAGTVKSISTDLQYQTKYIRQNWSNALISGHNKYVQFKDGKYFIPKIYTDPFSRIATILSKLTFEIQHKSNLFGNKAVQPLSDADLKSYGIKLEYWEEDKKTRSRKKRERFLTVSDIRNASSYNQNSDEYTVYAVSAAIKQYFSDRLLDCGISISVEDFDTILRNKYQDTSLDSFGKFLESVDFTTGFLNQLTKLKSKIESNVNPTTLWNNMQGNYSKFIDLASLGVYQHMREKTQLSVLTVEGKKIYLISENTAITDRLDELQRIGSTKLKELLGDPYYSSGSEIFETLSAYNDKIGRPIPDRLNYVALCGFKTDNVGSEGIEYTNQSEVEDYVAKYALLSLNYLISPTFSDKTSYGGIKGMKVFGFDYMFDSTMNFFKKYDKNSLSELQSHLGGVDLYSQTKQYVDLDGNTHIHVKLPVAVLNRFKLYLIAEYNSARSVLNDRSIKKENKVEFFHGSDVLDPQTKEVVAQAVQGARMSTFTKLLIPDADMKLTEIDVNYVNIPKKGKRSLPNEEYLLNLVKTHFIDKSNAEQLQIIEAILNRLIEKELKRLEDIQIIQKDNFGNYVAANIPGKYVCKLDKTKLDKISAYLKKSKDSSVVNNTGADANNAVIAYVADMVVKAQRSHQELARLYYGNPAYYSWVYDGKTGKLLDTTTDMFKRLGGLVSTGKNNFCMLPKGLLQGYETYLSKTQIANLTEELKRHLELHDRLFCSGKSYFAAEIENPKLPEEEAKKLADTFKKESIRQLKEKYVLRELLKVDGTIKGDISIQNLEDTLYAQIVANYTEKIKQMSDEDIDSKLGADIVNQIIKTVDFQNSTLMDNEVADGATYITGEMCKALLIQQGIWNNELNTAFNILLKYGEEDKIYSDEDMLSIAKAYRKIYTSVIGTQKYTAYGQRPVNVYDQNGKLIPGLCRNETYYLKTALFPIFSCMATGHLRLILDKMHTDGVDLVAVHSAMKTGSKSRVKMDDSVFEEWDNAETGKEAYSNFHFRPYELRFADIRKQFNTDPKDKDLMSLGTQMVKVALSLLDVGSKIKFRDQELNAKEFRDMFMNAINSACCCGHAKLNNKYFERGENGLILKEKEFVELLSDQIRSRDGNSELIDAVSIGRDGKMKMNLASTSGTDWIQSILASVINKRVIDINTPGKAFYQRSCFAAEGKGLILGDGDYTGDYVINRGNRLLANNEKNSMDCVLSIDFFDYLFKKHKNLATLSFEVKKQWLIDHNIISGYKYSKAVNGEYVYVTPEGGGHGRYEKYDPKKHGESYSGYRYEREWHDADPTIVGYRIPTQAVSSIHAMRCVDVISTVRDTIILPSQIVSITGSDFDIDKFFLSTLHYRELEDGTITSEFDNYATKEDYSDIEDLNDEELSSTKKYNENKIIKMLLALLTNTGNNMNLLYGPIDSDTKPLKTIAKEIKKREEDSSVDALDSTSLRTNIYAKMSFAIGKRGIGPFALNNNNHVLTMLYGVKFKEREGDILTTLGLTDLSSPYDKNGMSIMSWISGLINAHVDVAKDPYIHYLGVNAYTYNLVNLLIRTGYSTDTFYFTTQPIMERMYVAFNNASGVYMQDENVSVYTRQKEAVQDVFVDHVNKMLKENFATFGQAKAATIEEVNKQIRTETNAYTYDDFVRSLFTSKEGCALLKKIATSKKSELQESYTVNVSNSKVTTSFEIKLDLIQAVVGEVNFELQEKAEGLSKLVQYTKIDTKKHGKTLGEQLAYMLKMEDLKDIKKSPFETSGINALIELSYVGYKTRTAISDMAQLLAPQLYEGSDTFIRLIYQVFAKLGITDPTAENYKTVTKMIKAHMRSKYFFGKDRFCDKFGLTNVASLLRGRNSILTRLQQLKDKLSDPAAINDPKYSKYIDPITKKCNNYLLNALMAAGSVEAIGDEWIGAQFIQNMQQLDDNIKSNYISMSWRDMLNDGENPEMLKFANDLVVYAFLTSVDAGGRNDLFKFVPLEWRTGESQYLVQHNLDQSWNEFNADMLNKYHNSDIDNNVHEDLQLTDEDIETMILNWSWDNKVVRTLNSLTSVDTSVCVRFLPTVKRDNQTELLPQLYNGGTAPLMFGAVNGISESGISLMFKEDGTPTYVKLSTKAGREGLNKYIIYKLIGWGSRRVNTPNGTDVVKYPIYSVVQPIGGRYKNKQTIYDFGTILKLENLTKIAPINSIYKEWGKTYRSIVAALGLSIDVAPEAVLAALVNGTLTDLITSISKLVNVSSIQSEAISALLTLSTDVAYSSDSSTFGVNEDAPIGQYLQAADSTDDIQTPVSEARARNTERYRSTTDLNLNKIPIAGDRYTHVATVDLIETPIPSKGDAFEQFKEDLTKNISEMFDSYTVDAVLNLVSTKGLHIEFYKRRYEENEKEYYSPCITISFATAKSKGFFELVRKYDHTNGELTDHYYVHFKTYNKNDVRDPETQPIYATTELTQGDKDILFNALINLVPIGSTVSTVGTLTKGGLSAMNKLGKYGGQTIGKLVKTDDTATVSNGTEDVEIPIYIKLQFNDENSKVTKNKTNVFGAISDNVDKIFSKRKPKIAGEEIDSKRKLCEVLYTSFMADNSNITMTSNAMRLFINNTLDSIFELNVGLIDELQRCLPIDLMVTTHRDEDRQFVDFVSVFNGEFANKVAFNNLRESSALTKDNCGQ